jgi:serine/threonine protein kinase
MKTLKNGEYEYRESDFLGEGSFAKVYRGLIVKSQRVVAVRLLPLKLIKQYGNKIKGIISNSFPTQTAKSQSSRNWLKPRT